MLIKGYLLLELARSNRLKEVKSGKFIVKTPLQIPAAPE